MRDLPVPIRTCHTYTKVRLPVSSDHSCCRICPDLRFHNYRSTLLLVLVFQRRRSNKRVYIVVIHYDTDAAGDDIVRAFGRMRYYVKSKTLRAQTAEMAVEVFCRPNEVGFMERLRAVSGVQDVTLVQYNGEYHG